MKYGHIESRYNSWDFDSMGLKINEILSFNSDTLDRDIKEYLKNINDYNLSIIRVDESDRVARNTLEKHNYKMKEVTYEIISTKSTFDKLDEKIIDKKYEIKDFCELSELKKITKKMFKHGRYIEDCEIDYQLSDDRNVAWVAQLCKSDNVFKKFLFKNHKLIGFMFGTHTDTICTFTLGGVIEEYSHMASFFWKDLILENKNKKIQTTISATNLGILKLYLNFNFKIQKVKVGYHKVLL